MSKLFFIAKDIIKSSKLEFPLNEGATVGELRQALSLQYPDFAKLRSLAFAVNSDYVKDDRVLNPSDEVVLIPPVSGG